MDKHNTIELTLDGIAQGGEGVGRHNGRVVFVGGALPGERVLVRLTEQRDAYARGVAEQILESSADRADQRMAEADHMPWQHITYPAQLRFKQQILREQLAKIAQLRDVDVEPTVPAAREWNYRSSARLHIERGQVGYYAAGSRSLRPISRDPLLHPLLNETLGALTGVLRRNDGPADVLMRASESNGYVVAALKGKGDYSDLARRWRAQAPQLAGVSFFGDALGNPQATEEFADLDLTLGPESFFQVNRAGAATLLRLVEAGLQLGGTETLLDLYCGIGTFALPLSRRAGSVTGVEEFASSVATAETTAQANGISNVRFVAGRVEDVLTDMEGPADAVVLDPPRRGCHPRALDALLRLAPARIVYVSCHPATLARDLGTLSSAYRVTGVQPVDMFPQTAHIESVTTLVRQ